MSALRTFGSGVLCGLVMVLPALLITLWQSGAL